MYKDSGSLELLAKRKHIEELVEIVRNSNSTAEVLRFRTENDERHYDHDKVQLDLLGKKVRVEYFSTAFNPEVGYKQGCYKVIEGIVTDINVGDISYIVLDNCKAIDPHVLTDIKIEVLEG